ncbi:MAG: hypothetical protein EB075_07135 [Bacteroidetes bacterium]|nr:hypothetical protein [Bacteroidota bacterium]
MYCGATEDATHVRYEYGDSVKLGAIVLAFYKELTALKRRIAALPEYADTIASRKAAHTKKKRFHEGTAVSVVLAEHEADYVRTAIRYFQSRGFSVSSYAYDGFHVTLKKPGELGLGEVEYTLQHINKTLPVRFIVKPWPKLLSTTHAERMDKLEPAMKFLLPRSSNSRKNARLYQAMKGAIPAEIMQSFTEMLTAMHQPSADASGNASAATKKQKPKKRWGPDPDVLVLDAPKDLMNYLEQLSKETGTAMREPLRELTYKLVLQDRGEEEVVLVQGRYVYDTDSGALIGWLNGTTATVHGEERSLGYADTPVVSPEVIPYAIPVGMFSLLPAFLTAENRIYVWVTPKMAYEVGYLDGNTQQVYLSLTEN